MSCSNLPPFILQELSSISEIINYPIKNVQRIKSFMQNQQVYFGQTLTVLKTVACFIKIGPVELKIQLDPLQLKHFGISYVVEKYTCFNISKSLIAFGATSGGVYVFNRSPCEFVQLIPNKDGAITRLSISPDGKYIGFATGKGLVTVTACNQSLSGGHSTVASKEHQGNEVTAMVWSANNMLFSGDDVGKISVLQLQSFIAKTMFHSSSLTIMCLDSRICQIDVKSCMLLISTLTRCYICDTSQEQYRQIGQKFRDGEYGACFVNKEKNSEQNAQNTIQDITEVKKYNIVDGDTGFAVGKDLENTLIFSARPSSRLWEATIDGAVVRTHQFKQVLGKKPMKILSFDSYQNEYICIDEVTIENEGQSLNFSNIYSINGAIFSFKKDALYFLNTENVDHTIWFDAYNDIIDCKVYHDIVYLWLSNGSLVNLRYLKIDKFLLKCYVEEKFALCAKICALFGEYFLSSNLSPKLHILVGLKDRLQCTELLSSIKDVLTKFDSLKNFEATQTESGIYVVDNTYNAQLTLLEDNSSKHSEDYKFGAIPPEAMQTLKDLSLTVSDKLSTSKKMLREKWEDFEDKMKHLNVEKQHGDIKDINDVQEQITKKLPAKETMEHDPTVLYDDIIYKEIKEISSQKATEVDNNSLEVNKMCKMLYQYYKLSIVGKEMDETNLTCIIESYDCDIRNIYKLMLLLEQYCVNLNELEESKFLPNNIFLTYLNESTNKEELLDSIVSDEVLYKYFVDSCIAVNMKSQKLSNLGCDCGFPLPYSRTNQTPEFSELIDGFIEGQWSKESKSQCYDICKRMPYLWRKILYLRRNEDLLNILRLLLQMLDESLLHSFLPQFTLDTWERTVQLYATLHANLCLNCSKRFDHISVRDTLSWDDLGALMIKSVGGKNAIKVLEKHAELLEPGAVTIKFYHTCLMVTMFEKYDVTVVTQLTDALYDCYNFEDSKLEICKLLRSTLNGQIKNTALPLVAAAKTTHWGLTPLIDKIEQDGGSTEQQIKNLTLTEILDNLPTINKGVTDCVLCGLPLQNIVLIKDGGLWVFKCGHTFHGACLDLSKIKLCPSCSPIK